MDLGGVVELACRHAGLAVDRASVVHRGENVLVAVGDVVVRIGRVGQGAAARRELAVARWLAECGIAASRPCDGIDQPWEVGGAPLTYWVLLPPHRQGRPGEIGGVLRRLHGQRVPDLGLPELDPFARLPERISAATVLPPEGREWLAERLVELRARWRLLRAEVLPRAVLHGDAWGGNIVVPHGSGEPVLLDFERCSLGPTAWDLTSIAIKHGSFGWISRAQYEEFADAVGEDVTTAPHHPLFRDIRELRMTCYFAQHASENPEVASPREARLRLHCLRGLHGPRPWPWTPAR